MKDGRGEGRKKAEALNVAVSGRGCDGLFVVVTIAVRFACTYKTVQGVTGVLAIGASRVDGRDDLPRVRFVDADQASAIQHAAREPPEQSHGT